MSQAHGAAADMAPVAADRLALRPRPVPDADVLAAITAAVQLAWPRPAPADEHNPVRDAWRFSGRWWAKPVPLRRDRPRAQH